jgi:hypothetical protein
VTTNALYVYGNTALTDIDGLRGLTSLGYGTHSVRSNTHLCASDVSALYASIGAANVQGTWSAASNDSGC